MAEGDFVTIRGPSGSGKSTLLAILGMLDGEYEGEYWFDGEPVHGTSVKRRNRLHRDNVGFVFQHFHLLDDLTVYENPDIPLSYRDVPPKERQSRVGEILDRFRIVGKRDLYPAQLSEQVPINLIKNGVEAADGVGGVRVRWHATDGGLEAEIEDDGPGLASTENLWVPFFTTKRGGSGIGLVLSREIVENHGGNISLENRLGASGCVARFELP